MHPRRLPESTRELAERLGMGDGNEMDLEQVRAAGEQLSDWVLQAAQERWPDTTITPIWWNKVRCDVAWKNACERWPGIQDIAETLKVAERYLLRGNKQAMA